MLENLAKDRYAEYQLVHYIYQASITKEDSLQDESEQAERDVKEKKNKVKEAKKALEEAKENLKNSEEKVVSAEKSIEAEKEFRKKAKKRCRMVTAREMGGWKLIL